MAISTTKTSDTFYDIVASVDIDCDWPLYAEDEVKVIYGQASLEAVLNVDFTVTLAPDDYDTFVITPTASLLTKINDLITADPTNEINYVTIRRVLENTTTVQPETVRLTPFLSREIERVHMKLQQLEEEMQRSVVLPPKAVGAADERYFIDTPEDGKASVWDEASRTFVPGPTSDEITNAQGYATSAEASAVSAAATLAQVQTLYDNFDDRYLGVKSSDPAVDNDGDPLTDGALYFNTTSNLMRIYDLGGTAWNNVTTSVLPGSIDTAELADGAVTSDKIDAGAVSTAKVADGAVTYVKLAAAALASLSDLVAGTASKIVTAASFKAWVDARKGEVFHIQHVEAQGVDGGTANNATYNVRPLNTTVRNGITGASLASNQITLPAGTYEISAKGHTYATGESFLRLYNVTDAADTGIKGLNANARVATPTWATATLTGQLTIAATKVLRLDHYTSGAQTSNGLGSALNVAGRDEVYAEVLIRKVP